MEQRRDVAESRHVRELVVDVVAKARRVDDGQGDAHAVLLEFYIPKRFAKALGPAKKSTHQH